MLISTTAVDEPAFYRAVILLLDHGTHGSAGVLLNRPLGHTVVSAIPELEPVVDPDAELSEGGPVEPNGVLGVTVDDAGRLVPADLDNPVEGAPLRLFRGHSGWGPGQLMDEFDAFLWWVFRAEPSDVFGPDPKELWHRVLARQTGRRRILAHMHDDPSVN